MKTTTIKTVLVLLFAGAISTQAQERAFPPPAPGAESGVSADKAEYAPVPPPVSPTRGSLDEAALDDTSAEEFDQALKSLRMELDSVRALRREKAADTGSVSVPKALATVTQRKILLNLLQQLATRGPQKREQKATQRTPGVAIEETDDADLQLLLDSNQTIDPFALGRALFRIGEYERAEQAFRGVTNNGQNEWFLKYLIATCLRKQNKIPEAVAIYQQVVLSKDTNADPILIESAQWQLGNIRWRQNMELQLKRLRDLRQGNEPVGDVVPENGNAGPATPVAPAAPANAL